LFKKRWWNGFGRFLLVTTAAVLFLSACGGTHELAETLIQEGDPLGAKVGDKAIDFTLPTPDGRGVSLEQYKGSPVVLYFWASWCGTCTFDLPDLEDAANWGADEDLVIITVNIGEQIEFVKGFVEETVGDDYRFIVASDTTLATFRQYRILSFPTTFFVDANGIIRDMRIGRINEKILAEKIQGIQGSDA